MNAGVNFEAMLPAYQFLSGAKVARKTIGMESSPMVRHSESEPWVARDGWGAVFMEEADDIAPPGMDETYSVVYHILITPGTSSVYNSLRLLLDFFDTIGGVALDLVSERVLTRSQVQARIDEGVRPETMTSVHAVLDDDGTIEFHSHGLVRFGLPEFSFRTDRDSYGEGYALAVDLIAMLAAGIKPGYRMNLPAGPVSVTWTPEGFAFEGVLSGELAGYIVSLGGMPVRPSAVQKGDWVKVAPAGQIPYWAEVLGVHDGTLDVSVVLHFDTGRYAEVLTIRTSDCVEAVSWGDG